MLKVVVIAGVVDKGRRLSQTATGTAAEIEDYLQENHIGRERLIFFNTDTVTYYDNGSMHRNPREDCEGREERLFIEYVVTMVIDVDE